MLELFVTFLKLGLFTFGGGYAMIPLIKDTIIHKKHWMTEDEVIEMLAIAESTPGPIAINMATYIGYKQKGVLGSILSTLGVVLPSLTIIFIISLCFDMFIANKYIAYAFVGIKCGVAILILKTGIEMLLKSKKTVVNMAVCGIVTALMIALDILAINMSAIVLILLGGILIGVVGGTIKEKLDEKDIDNIVSSVYNSKNTHSTYTTDSSDKSNSTTSVTEPSDTTQNVEQIDVDSKDDSTQPTNDNGMLDIDAIDISNDSKYIDSDSKDTDISLDDMIYNLEQNIAKKEQEKIQKETENLEHIDTISTTKTKNKKIDTKEKSIKVEKDDMSNLENMFGSATNTPNVHSKNSTHPRTNTSTKNTKDRRAK